MKKVDTKLIILKALCQSVKPSLTPNIYLIKLFSIKLFKMFHPFENNLFPFVLIETEQAFPQLEYMSSILHTKIINSSIQTNEWIKMYVKNEKAVGKRQ